MPTARDEGTRACARKAAMGIAIVLAMGCGRGPAGAGPEPPVARVSAPSTSAPTSAAHAGSSAASAASAASNAPTPPSSPSSARLAALPPDMPPLPADVATPEPGLSTAKDTVVSLAIHGYDVAPVFQAFLAAARAASFQIIAEHPLNWSASLVGPDGARAAWHIEINSPDLARGFFQRAHHAPAPLAGNCVAIPTPSARYDVRSYGIDQGGDFHQANRDWVLATYYLIDVDADGEIDAFVPLVSPRPRCPWDAHHEIYVMRGTCGYRVGVVGPGAVSWQSRTAAPDASGFRVLSTEASWADSDVSPIPMHHSVTAEFRFGGTVYQQRASAHEKGKCHHCGISHCQAL